MSLASSCTSERPRVILTTEDGSTTTRETVVLEPGGGRGRGSSFRLYQKKREDALDRMVSTKSSALHFSALYFGLLAHVVAAAK